jgi:hypothetical protein
LNKNQSSINFFYQFLKRTLLNPPQKESSCRTLKETYQRKMNKFKLGSVVERGVFRIN